MCWLYCSIVFWPLLVLMESLVLTWFLACGLLSQWPLWFSCHVCLEFTVIHFGMCVLLCFYMCALFLKAHFSLEDHIDLRDYVSCGLITNYSFIKCYMNICFLNFQISFTIGLILFSFSKFLLICLAYFQFLFVYYSERLNFIF